MITLARHDGDEDSAPPLSWMLRDMGEPWDGITRALPDGRHVVVMTVCDRGHVGTLPHAIAADGTVSPSIVCAGAQYAGCKFHDYARLDGWTHGALARAA